MKQTLPKLKRNQIDLLKELIRSNLKLRYSDSILGVLWVLMKPLLNFLTLFFVFGAFRQGFSDDNFAARLMVGLIVYTYFQEGITIGMNSLINMSNIILKVNFPRNLAVLGSLLVSLVNFFINLLIILVLTLTISFVPDPVGTVYFFAIMFVLFIFMYSVSLISSILVIRIRDLQNIVPVMFQLLFWGSAIFYDIDELDGTIGDIVRANPIAIIIDACRNAVVDGQITYLPQFLALIAITLVMFVLARIYFSHQVKLVAEHI
ncbi:MAG: Teichoic acid translocation permease protein TagG [candidate division WS6 bacterium OLB20]|uniref:Transport permease protein n=1 Tax=candidate division WS6 bacterium OLB20 TaxID=1617426 RepID=A0A136LVZ6_9BACT|nr:MAG: Teichoic acid translocation permease protein TagG [candidate division WS6 bacterium OLB20]